MQHFTSNAARATALAAALTELSCGSLSRLAAADTAWPQPQPAALNMLNEQSVPVYTDDFAPLVLPLAHTKTPANLGLVVNGFWACVELPLSGAAPDETLQRVNYCMGVDQPRAFSGGRVDLPWHLGSVGSGYTLESAAQLQFQLLGTRDSNAVGVITMLLSRPILLSPNQEIEYGFTINTGPGGRIKAGLCSMPVEPVAPVAGYIASSAPETPSRALVPGEHLAFGLLGELMPPEQLPKIEAALTISQSSTGGVVVGSPNLPRNSFYRLQESTDNSLQHWRDTSTVFSDFSLSAKVAETSNSSEVGVTHAYRLKKEP